MALDKLLREFESLFRGVVFRHRISTNGDKVAGYLYDDLFDLNRSPKLVSGIAAHRLVLNKKNRTTGRTARRGDGTFGERVPAVPPQLRPGLAVALGDVATIEIGTEAKILAKAMIKQIDRVCTDMRNQADEFRRHNPNAICVGLVGINHAASYTGYEGTRLWPTDGKKYVHPSQEAAEAEVRIQQNVAPRYDETIVLRFMPRTPRHSISHGLTQPKPPQNIRRRSYEFRGNANGGSRRTITFRRRHDNDVGADAGIFRSRTSSSPPETHRRGDRPACPRSLIRSSTRLPLALFAFTAGGPRRAG